VSLCSTVDDRMTTAIQTGAEIHRPAGQRRDCRGRLLHGYLHKSSNSLCGIKGYASLIAGRSGSGARTIGWARKIIAEVELLEDVYHSVRDMAFPMPAKCTDSENLATALADACDAAAARHTNLRLGPLPRADGPLLLPAGDLLQVLSAILDNSAESRIGPVEVTFGVQTTGNGRIILRLSDDGPGMPREMLAQVLEPFITTRQGHLGIGLARVDTIMDMHGLGWGLRSVPLVGTTVSMEVARSRKNQSQT
jgi:signal transduction histidine kinase